MKPNRLSATGIKVFEDCEARFKAEYVDQVRSGSGAPANLGTAVHDTCEWFVKTGAQASLDDLLKFFNQQVTRHSLEAPMAKDGRAMIKSFYTDWMENPPYKVLSAELREDFTIKSEHGTEFQVVYIWDRGDLHPDGSIEVIDYKTWRRKVDGDEMKQILQVRLYALSAAIKYKDDKPPAIWVTLDQMRYGKTSVKFTRDDNAATWAYLKAVATRIEESDGTRETVGEGCRYCVRRAGCGTLERAVAVGNVQRYLSDPKDAATKLAELKAAKGAIEDTISELEEHCTQVLEDLEVPVLQFDNGVELKMSPRKTRRPEMGFIRKILGPELMERYGKVGMSELDEILAGSEVSDEQKSEIKSYITTTVTGKATATFKKT